MSRRSHAVLVLMAACLVSCAGRAVEDPNDLKALEGTWQGRVLGPAGPANVVIAIAADGAFTGTMAFHERDRPFQGRIVRSGGGVIRYLSTDGAGRVRLENHDGVLALRLVRDGGPGGGVLERKP